MRSKPVAGQTEVSSLKGILPGSDVPMETFVSNNVWSPSPETMAQFSVLRTLVGIMNSRTGQ